MAFWGANDNFKQNSLIVTAQLEKQEPPCHLPGSLLSGEGEVTNLQDE